MQEIEYLYEDMKIIDDSDIGSLIDVYRQAAEIRQKLSKLDEMVKDKVRVYMKEHRWDTYQDKESRTTITISKLKRKHIDEKQLRHFLTAAQLSQVITFTEFERLDIITPEIRDRMKKFVRGR